MDKLLQNISVILGLSFLLCFGSECLGEAHEEEVIATLNGEPIYLSEVEQNVAFQVYRLRANIYSLLKEETEELVNQRLLEAEAARRGLSVEELLRKEVDEKVPPFDEKKVDEYLADHPEEAGKGPERRNRIRIYLSQRAVIQRKLDLLASLRQKADFKFLLEMPQRPRIKLDTTGEPWRGKPDAPVTLVHFASFTCKLCAESVNRIGRLMADFPGKIKWVHRNFFSIYDERALTAAEMGELAHEQGRFWDFHDLMFERQGDFKLDDIMQVARELNLSRQRYKEGQKRGRYLLEVKDDLRYGARIGVTAVPVIFVNGIYFSGTFPYKDLKALVQRELERSGR